MKQWAMLAFAWFTVLDAGGFEPTGRHVEFADRFGWRAYESKLEFQLDENGASKPRLKLEIKLADGGVWKHTCRDPRATAAAVPGFGTTVIVDCVIPAKEFAKAVGLDAEDVGSPTFSYQAMVQDGKARPGAQRSLHFLPEGAIAGTSLAAYAGGPEAPAVVFRSN